MKQALDLAGIKQRYQQQMAGYKARVIICAGTGCVANGSLKIYERFLAEIWEKGLSVSVTMEKEQGDFIISESGCQGFCQMGPLVTILPQQIFYTKVRPEDVPEIVEKTLLKGEPVDRLLYVDAVSGDHELTAHDIPFYAGQSRIVLHNCGQIDAMDIEEYIACGGYAMAQKACLSMTAQEVCQAVADSGMRGRGGGGFPTGRKWQLTLASPGPKKYVICNGDEGDPGAFMDRSVMEGNPHCVIEGMIIAGKGVGADEGYVYVRTEYPLAVGRMRKAVEDARRLGILGQGVFGSDHNFEIHVMEGAGAFVCGEETALISSIEGKRGMPSPKPPFPATSGLFGLPTVINNVETLASIPIVLSQGESYSRLGTESSRGTKTFALTGHVANTGLIEVPFGATLRQIIGEIGGGVTNDDGTNCGVDYKAVQIGGPSGGCLTPEHIDMPLDYENLKEVGAMVGSGGLVVMNQQTCMVSIARFFMQFTQNESCGKCVVCREGTKQMLSLLDDIIEGRGSLATLDLLEELAITIQLGSLCGLGKTAPNPVLSTLKNFRDEYVAHVEQKYCPAGSCGALSKYLVDANACKGCGLCAKKCPVNAISGAKGQAYTIDQSACIKCGVCLDSCKFKAICRK